MLRGVVHDPTARRMGGVAGHAGLFITIHDLAKYCRMLLRGGSPIFSSETVNMMTTVQSPPNVAVRRTGGFDFDSSFSKPRGEMFPIGSFGHTGFTGTSMWMDPETNTYVILLANSVHPFRRSPITALRGFAGLACLLVLAMEPLALAAAGAPGTGPSGAPPPGGGPVEVPFARVIDGHTLAFCQVHGPATLQRCRVHEDVFAA